VFDGWEDAFRGATLVAVDLHDGLDVAQATHAQFAEQVVRAAAGLDGVALCGWSMGGLVVLEAAQSLRPDAVVLIEPSPPAEVQGRDESVEVTPGTFDPESVYGPFPDGMRARPESLAARGERKRGISVPGLPCRSLVVAGDEFREERGEAVARHLGSTLLDFPGLGHWDLVRAPEVRRAVADFLGVA
jgi:pimeloyl-ACP methyl ester carboxylesterase